MTSRLPTPFAAARDIRIFDPLLDFHREMNRMFDNVFSGTGLLSSTMPTTLIPAMPRIDVQEDEQELCICAELPGIKASEVDVRVDQDTLSITGEKTSQMERRQSDYHVMERSFGRFQRTVPLPFTPDPEQVHADYQDGVLTIRMPKLSQHERSRRIEVHEGSNGHSPGQTRMNAPAQLQSSMSSRDHDPQLQAATSSSRERDPQPLQSSTSSRERELQQQHGGTSSSGGIPPSASPGSKSERKPNQNS